MLSSLYTSISAMSTIEVNQSIVTKNIANQDTIGYKSDTLLTKPFDDVLLSNNDNYKDGVGTYQEIGKINWGVRIDNIITNHTQGTLIESGNATDFAIVGDGLFALEGKDGNISYTRDGVMGVDSEGYLVNSTGYRVLGVNSKNGNTETIKVDNKQIQIDLNNNILLDNEDSYKFKIVEFKDKESLIREGNNLYKGTNGVDTLDYSIKHKMRETSNVDILQETTNLMTNMKMYETNQKVVQQIDSILGKIASEVGRV